MALLMMPLISCEDSTPSFLDTRGGDAQIDVNKTKDTELPDSQPGDVESSTDAVTNEASVPDFTPPDTAALDGILGCNTAKIGFSQSNPAHFELYQLCIQTGDVTTEKGMKAIDPKLSCVYKPGGVFAKCLAGTWVCTGQLTLDSKTKAILATKWKQLCAISLMKVVGSIVGGHYL